ncbi:MAG: hypothetical protein ACI9UO_001895 [Nitrospinales bacterium]|jgi:hypothetical protein
MIQKQKRSTRMDREEAEEPLPPIIRVSNYEGNYTSAASSQQNIPTYTTQPTHHLQHIITDAELDMLSDLKRGYLYEGQWACIGIFIGSVPQSFQAIYDRYFASPIIPLPPLNLFITIICIISFVLFFVIKFGKLSNEDKAVALCETIRKRPKRSVQR